MTLTIHKLSTHCRSPRGLERLKGVAEDAARGPLASELSAQLGPSLERLPPVVRLNELRVKVRIPARNLSTFTLADAWARAFTLALHQALAHPPGDGKISSRRYESETGYKAELLRHIVRNGVTSSWQFPELARWHGRSPAEAVLGVLLDDPQEIGEILAELQRSGSLEPILALCAESALEKILLALDYGGRQSAALTFEGLIELGTAAGATGGLVGKWSLSSRRQAIRLWARTGHRFPLRSLWHGLRLLHKFLEMPFLLASAEPASLADAIPFPPWCHAIAIQAAASPRERAASSQISHAAANLFGVLETLRPLVPSSANPAAMASSAHWIVSDSAGMLLLLSIARRLDLWRYARSPEFMKFGGPRALSFFLAGIGMKLLGATDTRDSIEPSVATFAGILDQPDLIGMSQFFSNADVHAVQEFAAAQSWPDALELAATAIAQTFARLVRGFRTASRDAIVRQFVRIPGRILIEESRVLVVLAPSPWSVALRISGMDDRVTGIEWLGYRSVEFVLEGL